MAENFDIDIPFVDFIGIYLIEKKNGYSKLGIHLKEEYKNSWGAVHGGVLCSLLDVTLATSARSLDTSCIGAITIEFKINFIKPACTDFFAEANSIKSGKSIIFSEGKILDKSNTIIAAANGSFKLIYK